ncbi:hypothetical protein bas34_0081 [Escherichia phage SelmaRatti]|uniref:PD(D/E)XK endonuclease domain-containing protein n=1 Tax=Escherichia phage SelmaRatti TaxID=2852006 RepID=A0AAE7VYD6_9CAUD|nr:hypothetical protein bas34_0081 [Escherichia phage SelmaRatti]
MNTNKKGNIGLGSAIAHFTSKGLIVSLPLNDSQDYDLIVDMGGTLNKVQVKYTSQKAPSGSYILAMRSTSGTSRVAYKTLNETNIDLVFVYTDQYQLLIPIKKLTNKNQTTLTKELVQEFRVI